MNLAVKNNIVHQAGEKNAENFQIPEFEAGPKCDLEKNKTVKSCDLKKDKTHFGHTKNDRRSDASVRKLEKVKRLRVKRGEG